MIKTETLERLRQHAGLCQAPSPSFPTIADCTAPRADLLQKLWLAGEDVISTLGALNYELNGATPSSGQICVALIPRSLVYAMTEIIRMVRELLPAVRESSQRSRIEVLAKQIESAWSAVLAGDVDDLHQHLAQEGMANEADAVNDSESSTF